MQFEIDLPDDLNPDTKLLIASFAEALGEKLHAAEKKYGYSNGWKQDDWMRECRAKLREHMEKGDPRDVAAYCAFLWHHGEATVELPNQYAAGALARIADRLCDAVQAGDVKEIAKARLEAMGCLR